MVSRLVARLSEQFEVWKELDLGADDIAVLFLEGFHLRVRIGQKVESLPVLCAVGVRSDESKVLLALELRSSESSAAWRSVTDDLCGRWVTVSTLAVIDGSNSLCEAEKTTWPWIDIQRCARHKLENRYINALQRLCEEIKDDYHAIVYAARSMRAESMARFELPEIEVRPHGIEFQSWGAVKFGSRVSYSPRPEGDWFCSSERRHSNMRIFYTSDIHGSEVCFIKFLNAGSFYKADAIILGGDITGKLLVPIVKSGVSYNADFQGQRFNLSSEKQLQGLEKAIRNSGSYFIHLNQKQLFEAKGNPDLKERFFHQAMNVSIASWMRLAESRLAGSDIECYIMLGNDDQPDVAQIIDQCPRVINHDGRKVIIKGKIEMIGLGYSNLTLFKSPRELSECDLERKLDAMARLLDHPESSIFNIHAPPYDCGLDSAPELDDNLTIKSYGGQPRHVPVGSKAVSSAIVRYQPLLGLHGHVHESRGAVSLGKTLCLNPGSAYASGVLQGVIIDLESDKVRSYQLVSG